MLYSPRDSVRDGVDMLLAFRRILDCRLPLWDDFNEALECLSVFLPVVARVCFVESIFLIPRQKVFFFYERKRLNRYFERLCTLFLSRIGIIENLGRFKDDARIATCWFSG